MGVGVAGRPAGVYVEAEGSEATSFTCVGGCACVSACVCVGVGEYGWARACVRAYVCVCVCVVVREYGWVGARV